MFKRYRKIKLFTLFVLIITGMFIVITLCDKKITEAASMRVYSDTMGLPGIKTGLLLGTAKSLANGHINPYYHYRIEAAALLMNSGKIKYLIISGDNSRKDYNEPQMMKSDLAALGIDSSKIYLDYAGFRTFDSMVRLREIFSQDSVLVISQRFHNERALYIAQREGIHAIGFNAKDVSEHFGFKVRIREKLARVKVFLDYLLGNDPKFLGPKVEIPA